MARDLLRMWLFAAERAHEHPAQVAHPAVVIECARARRAADGQALHDAEDRVVGVVVDLPHVDFRADRAVGKSLADRLAIGPPEVSNGSGGWFFDLVVLPAVCSVSSASSVKRIPFGSR